MNAAIKRLTLLTVLLTAASSGASLSTARAEEGGNGHYLPGATSSFIDMMPDRETSAFAYLNAFTYYHGSASASREFEIGGRIAADVKSTFYADTSFFLYQLPWDLLGGQYAAGISVPYVWRM